MAVTGSLLQHEQRASTLNMCGLPVVRLVNSAPGIQSSITLSGKRDTSLPAGGFLNVHNYRIVEGAIYDLNDE